MTGDIQQLESTHQAEIDAGERFAFGKNWSQFLSVLSEDRLCSARNSLCEMLQTDKLSEKSFLDIGCGSGLFSLAAVQLVHAGLFDRFRYAKRPVRA